MGSQKIKTNFPIWFEAWGNSNLLSPAAAMTLRNLKSYKLISFSNQKDFQFQKMVGKFELYSRNFTNLEKLNIQITRLQYQPFVENLIYLCQIIRKIRTLNKLKLSIVKPAESEEQLVAEAIAALLEDCPNIITLSLDCYTLNIELFPLLHKSNLKSLTVKIQQSEQLKCLGEYLAKQVTLEKLRVSFQNTGLRYNNHPFMQMKKKLSQITLIDVTNTQAKTHLGGFMCLIFKNNRALKKLRLHNLKPSQKFIKLLNTTSILSRITIEEDPLYLILLKLLRQISQSQSNQKCQNLLNINLKLSQ
eukprot:403364427